MGVAKLEVKVIRALILKTMGVVKVVVKVVAKVVAKVVVKVVVKVVAKVVAKVVVKVVVKVVAKVVAKMVVKVVVKAAIRALALSLLPMAKFQASLMSAMFPSPLALPELWWTLIPSLLGLHQQRWLSMASPSLSSHLRFHRQKPPFR